MVYETDFYTTRRPYRASPSLSTYTVSSLPSRQVRILPGLGKVHIVHTYDRIVPYVGHKRLTVVTTPPKVYATRPSVLHREYERIENKIRPWVSYSPTNRYLNSDSAVRSYYINYPITGVNYTTYYRPNLSYYPKAYRWYYDWPRVYSTYWPYLRSLWNYRYTPLYKSLNYYDDLPYYYNYYWPSYYSSSFRPNLKSLDYEFNDLENKISDLRKFVYATNPITAIDYPETKKDKVYRPLNLYYDHYWPLKALNKYADEWPNYDHLIYRNTYPSDRFYFLKGIFDDETRLIRAQTAALLKRVHSPVPRAQRSWPVSTMIRYDDGLPTRYTNDNYIHRLLTASSRNPKVEYTTYYTEPVKKYIGQGRLSCVSYAGDRAYNRRRHIFLYEDPLRSDIQLLSYYINKFRDEKKALQSSGTNKAQIVEEKQPEITAE